MHVIQFEDVYLLLLRPEYLPPTFRAEDEEKVKLHRWENV